MKKISIITILFITLTASLIPQSISGTNAISQALQEKLNSALAENAKLRKQVPSFWSLTLDASKILDCIFHPVDAATSVRDYVSKNPTKSIIGGVAVVAYGTFLWWNRCYFRELFDLLNNHKKCIAAGKHGSCGCSTSIKNKAKQCRSYIGLPDYSLRKKLKSQSFMSSQTEIDALIQSYISPAYIGILI